MSIVDLRSDTVTRPTAAMKQAIVDAPLGDDVFGDDPTVVALQEKAAELLGKEAALFVPTGTMANQVCIRAHTEPGDEIICSADSHIYLYEGAGFAALSGVSVACVQGEAGILSADGVRAAVRAEGSLSHYPVTSLVCLENTANRGGGSTYRMETILEIAEVAKEKKLKLHLDGARMFNAVVASGISAKEMVAPFDSISFCLSKGLGCPVGSLIVGSQAFIDRCHRFRKMFGGGMRQAGVLAAAGLYALENHIERMADDHRRARALAEAIGAIEGIEVSLESVKTNMVYIDISGTGHDAATVVDKLNAQEVALTAVSEHKLRAVTHLDVDDAGIHQAVAAFNNL
ncbi:MAG: low-specificity L-threonine aldolase [Deltaproteobacteria bacterium]|jgi:threonine aldolase|nr:low-specificity L-threonine aldolase [Deltaproteobacteria bacterium]MBT6433264.1 low-specificity L-threonine aldolase [Deltaproteobacteria bacterium]MBT6492585.1 low-specificity L-threonine aldolase [Deltaproteobacteria bacterium]